MIIRCPHCDHARTVKDSKVPSNAEFATCPRCKHRFRFRTVEPLRDARPFFSDNPPVNHNPPPPIAPMRPAHLDIWEAMEHLTAQMAQQQHTPKEQPDSSAYDENTSSPSNQLLEEASHHEAHSVASPEPSIITINEQEPEANDEQQATTPPRKGFFGNLFSRFTTKKQSTSSDENEDDANAVKDGGFTNRAAATPISPFSSNSSLDADELPPWAASQPPSTPHKHMATSRSSLNESPLVNSTNEHDDTQPQPHSALGAFNNIPPAAAHEEPPKKAPSIRKVGEYRNPWIESTPTLNKQPEPPLAENDHSHSTENQKSSEEASSQGHLAHDQYNLFEILQKQTVQTAPLSSQQREHIASTIAMSSSLSSPDHSILTPESSLSAYGDDSEDTPLASMQHIDNTTECTPSEPTIATSEEPTTENIAPQTSPIGSYDATASAAPKSTAHPTTTASLPHWLDNKSPIVATATTKDTTRHVTNTLQSNSSHDSADLIDPAAQSELDSSAQAPQSNAEKETPAYSNEPSTLDAVLSMHSANFQYSFEDTSKTPEEKTNENLKILTATLNRPVKDLGRIDDFMPTETTDAQAQTNSTPIPWENIRQHGWFFGFIRTIHGVMFNAPLFYSYLSSKGSLAPSYLFSLIQVYLAICCFAAWKGLFISLMYSSSDPLSGTQQSLPMLLLLAPLGLGLLLTFFTSLTRILLQIFSPKKAPFHTLFKVICYATGPFILSFIPFIGPLVAFFWFSFALATGCHHALRIKWTHVLYATVPTLLSIVTLVFLFMWS